MASCTSKAVPSLASVDAHGSCATLCSSPRRCRTIARRYTHTHPLSIAHALWHVPPCGSHSSSPRLTPSHRESRRRCMCCSCATSRTSRSRASCRQHRRPSRPTITTASCTRQRASSTSRTRSSTSSSPGRRPSIRRARLFDIRATLRPQARVMHHHHRHLRHRRHHRRHPRHNRPHRPSRWCRTTLPPPLKSARRPS